MSSNNSKMKRPLVPRLRFPEFREAGEWEYYQLGQCLSSHPEYGVNAAAVPYAENLPTYLRITDISEDGQIRLDQKVSVEKDITDENYLEDGDIVLARTGASVGRAYKYRPKDGRLVFAGFLIRIRPNQEKLISEFLFQFLASEQYWRWVDFTSARSGQPGINANEYASLPLQLPPTIKEQQKIADCLSSLDERITLEAQKLEALKRHKKGLMQQLFPREGTVPRLRFPGLAEEWRDDRIGKIAEIYKGKGIAKSDIGNNGIHSCIHYGELYTVYSELITNVVSKTSLPAIDLFFGEPNDVIIPSSGETKEDIAKAACVIPGGIAFSGDLNVLRTQENGVFLSYYLNGPLRKYIARVAQGYSVVHLYPHQIEKLPIAVPAKNEQQKIADCLSSLDDLISLHSQKIELLKRHKNGLMQQLFPVMDEILA